MIAYNRNLCKALEKNESCVKILMFNNKIYFKRGILYVFIILFITPDSLFAKDQIEANGDFLQIAIPSIAYGATFYIDDKIGRTEFYKSFFTSLAITHGLKSVVSERRPNGSSKSFPSGHTSAAFQGAAFIHKRYGFEYSIPAYLAATYVGYSRVESEKHYTHDVLAGAIIGTLSSFYFTSTYSGYSIQPVVMCERCYGFRISKAW